MVRRSITSLAVLFLAVAGGQSEPSNLFQNDPVIYEISTPAELINFVRSTSNSTCGDSTSVLFYSSWCPHCRNFSPRWSDFGRAVQKCTQGSRKVAAFECTDNSPGRFSTPEEVAKYNITGLASGELNPRGFCRRFVQTGFPTIGLFSSPDCPLRPPAKHIELSGILGPGVDYYILQTLANRLWLGSLLDALKESHAFEPCDYLKKSENDTDQVLIKVLDDIAEKDQRSAGGKSDEYNGGQQLSTSPEGGPEHTLTLPRWIPSQESRDPNARYHDAILGIYTMLNDWIIADSPKLVGSKLDAARNFLKLVVSIYPDELLIKLTRKIDNMKEVDTSKLQAISDGLRLSGVPPTDDALTCYTRTCLVWTLMHTLTVGQYLVAQANPNAMVIKADSERNLPSVDAIIQSTSNSGAIIEPAFIPEILHQLTQSFFNCETCQQHYHMSFEKGLADRIAWTTGQVDTKLLSVVPVTEIQSQTSGLVLWFWRFHNLVNIRTGVDEAVMDLRRQVADGEHEYTLLFDGQDMRFPRESLCQPCRDAKAVADNSSITVPKINPAVIRKFVEGGEDESRMEYDFYQDFNLDRTLDFLVQIFSPRPFGSRYVPDVHSFN